MAIRAQYRQILFWIIVRIAINMINFKRNIARNWVFFMPATLGAFIFIFI